MAQTEVNPWDMVSEAYPPGTIIRGRVRNLTNYGAFIELQEGIDGLLHITDMSWTKKITHPSEVVKKGEEVECVVLSVDQEKKRIALGLKQLQADPWSQDIPARYHIGDSVPVPAVEVIVAIPASEFGVHLTTDDLGQASFPDLGEGEYMVILDIPGDAAEFMTIFGTEDGFEPRQHEGQDHSGMKTKLAHHIPAPFSERQ